MAVTFTRALAVSPEEPIASRQLANLAAAFNDRIRSGLGDPTWRIYFLLLSLVRQIRNSGAADEFPPLDEFFTHYQPIDASEGSWPVAAAGTPEGVNAAGALGAWRFGSTAFDIFDEPGRVSLVPTGTVGMDVVNGWTLAKEQRGAVDPLTGSYGTPLPPARVVGYAHERILFAGDSPHGLSYGSWVKHPDDERVVLSKFQSEMLSRMLNTFIREFRGSDSQRLDPAYHADEAFPFQQFFTNQYHLAAQRGIENTTTSAVDAVYPLWRGRGAAGTELPLVLGGTGTVRNWTTGFALTGFLVRAATAGLAQEVSVGILGDVGIFGVVNLTPADPATVLYLPKAILAPTGVRCILQTDLAGIDVEVEMTELEARPPTIGDAYTVLRCGTAKTDEVPDGQGTFFETSRLVGEEYFRTGCIVNPSASAGAISDEVTTNVSAPYEAVRRLTRFVRVMRRQEFTGYAVEGGRSVLWFKESWPVDVGTTAHPWRDMMPVVHTAAEKGVTNEWVLDVELRPYDTDDASLFKPDAYSDYIGLMNRCLFYEPSIPLEPALHNHVAYGVPGGLLIPEAPPGWNYTIIEGPPLASNNANLLDCGGDPDCEDFRREFYRSCRVYEPPVEVDSIVVEGTEIKVTLTGRLHHCPEAPAGDFARDTATWDTAALHLEPHRTEENGLREYLIHAGSPCARPAGNQQIPAGNSAISASVWTDSGRPYGACYPRFRFTQLLPVPFGDANDDQDPDVDTWFLHDPMTQAELYLRAMAEGYVDAELSAEQSCLSGGPTLYDFNFTALCQQAFGRDRFDVIPGINRAHGPLPNTDAIAAIYNQFVSAINLLTRVRVMLPTILECNTSSLTTTEIVEGVDGFGNPVDCGEFGTALHSQAGSSPPSLPLDDEAWVDCGGGDIGVIGSHSVTLRAICSGTGWTVEHKTTEGRIRYRFTDSDVREAIPEAWRSQFEDNPGFLVKRSTCTIHYEYTEVTDPTQATQCFDAEAIDVPAFPSPGGYVKLVEVRDCPEGPCSFADGVHVTGGATAPTWLAVGFNGHLDECVSDGGASNEEGVTTWDNQVPTLGIELV